jgi:tRNA(Ser,Leu) C12 N-acetylase TAN1
MRNTIEMAREAGLLTWLKPPEDVIERFKAFEALVRADEREACAKVCEALNKYMDDGEECAAAIRNRGNT